MKRFIFIIPIMVVVATLAIWLLNKDYSEINYGTRILIVTGGSIFSGIISYFLLRNDKQKIDPKTIDPIKK